MNGSVITALRIGLALVGMLAAGDIAAEQVLPQADPRLPVYEFAWPLALAMIAALWAIVWRGNAKLQATLETRFDKLEAKQSTDHGSNAYDIRKIENRVTAIEAQLRGDVRITTPPPGTVAYEQMGQIQKLTASVDDLRTVSAGLMERFERLQQFVFRNIENGKDERDRRDGAIGA